ncbi:hypothetical protein L6164_033643 [Bauhinia variegata]|uniref:Uncharacterized protein n=1 Tax=Bauhinia variegata TaxID=167791 RepID=A0ACB9KSK0_BAUVA|nr:hypothetical protein L6164_033643 [Bauhinia variegata]
MWPVLLAAAVAGSTGLVAKHFLSTSNADPEEKSKQCNETSEDPGFPFDTENLEGSTSQHLVVPSGFDESGFEHNFQKQDELFTFSSLGSSRSRQHGLRFRNNRFRKKPVFGCRGSKNGFRVAAKVEQTSDVEVRSEQRKGGRRLPFCLKRRKITKNVAAKAGCCSSKDSSLFEWGLSIGTMYTMSIAKAEINNLSKAMEETARVVHEINYELNRRKSPHSQQNLNPVNIEMNYGKMSARHNEVILDMRKSGLRDIDVKILSLPVSEDGECGSSALTEEPDRPVLEMDQLEAELQFELQKLPGCTIGGTCHEEMRSNLHEIEFTDERGHGTDNQNFYYQSHGVSASELHQKLSHLLIEQQENQIVELESELRLAQSKLDEREAELQAMKDCVTRLTEFSLSTISDDETQACTDETGSSHWNSNNIDFESKQSVVGMKRPIGS